MHKSRTFLLAGAASTAVLLSMASAAPALAATEVLVTDRETVQVYMTASGEVKVARVYDQVTVTGDGSVDIENPVSTDGLRNLEGLSGVDVENGNAVATVDVAGEKRLRTVSTFDGELPVTITPKFTLDGEVYEDPEDLVGKSGELTVLYRVENITAVPTTLTVQDGQGNDVAKEVDVPMPLAGQLTTTLPKDFYSVRSDQATMSADGRGGTKMTFTMTLLPPVGSAVAEVGYTAQVSDAVIPRATVSIAVVQPLKNPSLSTAAASYQGGATTGATLTAGAEEIDANLLKLRDGAGELLGGLLLLSAGADELNQGLSEEAAPGANQLADGAGQAAAGSSELSAGLEEAETGSQQLADGVGQIAGGNRQLANGFNNPKGDPDLVSGSQDLAAGLGLISGGLTQLAGVDGLPAAYSSTLALRAGVDRILAGLGSASQTGTILNGLAQLSAGNTQLVGGVTQLRTGADQLASATSGLPAAKGGVDAVLAGISASSAPTTALITGIATDIAQARADAGCATACDAELDSAATALNTLATNLTASSTAAASALGQVSGGLGTAITGVGTGSNPGPTTLRGGLAQVAGGLAQSAAGLTLVTTGVNQVKLGLSNPACNTAKPTDSANPCGVREGLTLLSNGLLSAVTGVTQLSAGAKTAATGSGTLAEKTAEAGDGADQLADGAEKAESGAQELADGLVEASDGSALLADGNAQIADGADELATGLDAAAAGSAQIDDGLEQAADGAPALVDGAQRLSDEGTKKLVEAGNDTALDFGTKYAMIAAMAEMTKDGGLPYGAPDGATGSAAYSYELAAATHEGSRNMTRGLLAIGALGLGALLSTVIRARFS